MSTKLQSVPVDRAAGEFDVEALKTKKIAPKKKVLPIAGDYVEPVKPEIEEYGGSGDDVGVVDPEATKQAIIDTLKTVFDPEIPLNIYDLGLIYNVDVDSSGVAKIEMTLTAPGCPVAGMIVAEVAQKVGDTIGVSKSHVVLVWDPPWTKARMSEEAMLELGLL